MKIPQQPELPKTIPGMAEAEAAAEQAHVALAENEKRLAAAQHEAVQGYARRDALKSRIAAGEAVTSAELAAAETAIRDAESMARLLTDAQPGLWDRIDAAEREVRRLAEKVGAEMGLRAKTYLEEVRRFLADARSLESEAIAFYQRFTASVVGGVYDGGRHQLRQFAPSSAARQEAWEARKRSEKEVAQAARDEQQRRRTAEEARLHERLAREELEAAERRAVRELQARVTAPV
jgi:hypothetical protein